MTQEQIDRLEALKSMAKVTRCYHSRRRETLPGEGLCKSCDDAQDEINWEIAEIAEKYGLCPHGDKRIDCVHCDRMADMAYDARREAER